MASGKCDANSWGPLFVSTNGFVTGFALTDADLCSCVVLLVVRGTDPHVWTLVQSDLKETVHIVEERFLWHGPTARLARLIGLRSRGGGKWGSRVASEGVMDCF